MHRNPRLSVIRDWCTSTAQSTWVHHSIWMERRLKSQRESLLNRNIPKSALVCCKNLWLLNKSKCQKSIHKSALVDGRIDQLKDDFHNKPTKHTIQTRLEAAKSLDAFKTEAKPNHLEKKKPEHKVLFKDGRPLQKNEGKWQFEWTETPDTLRLDVMISKFLDTSLIDVDVKPEYLTILIKGKVLQLTMEHRVDPDRVICERSKMSGQLSITMTKEHSLIEDLELERRRERLEMERVDKEQKEQRKKEEERQKAMDRRYKNVFVPKEAVDYRNITSKIKLKPAIAPAHTPDFVDDPSVPPLM
ncbi:hypothetical protein EDD86DRAFT_93535 [Gorgonomyces haynaldii]|nr:hypothetical protein EDD86DRAFT_93535 [Gorgonomyces haynaldii]